MADEATKRLSRGPQASVTISELKAFLASGAPLSPEAEQAGLEAVATALFKHLRASGQFRKDDGKVAEAE